MTDGQDTAERPRSGDRRGDDRRGDNRRRQDRRAPPPPWRRPWAFVAYGLLAGLLLFVVFRGGDDAAAGPGEAEIIQAPQTLDVDPAVQPGADAPPIEAQSLAQFERLVAEGDAATGRRVGTRLFCGSLNSVAVRDVPRVPSSIAEHTDSSGRVPAAECKWGAATGAPEVLLVVPPDLANEFAAAPQVVQAFVRRRQLDAELEWIGRSDALALRTAVVLRRIR